MICTIAVFIGYSHIKLKISNKPQSILTILLDLVMYCLRNLNLNGLLVTCQINNTSSGGMLVAKSHSVILHICSISLSCLVFGIRSSVGILALPFRPLIFYNAYFAG